MPRLLEQLALFLIVANFALLASSRLVVCIQAVAVQGILLGFLPIISEWNHLKTSPVIIALTAMLLKGVVFPKMLMSALKQTNARREIEPFFGYAWSVIGGVAMLALAFWMDSRLVLPPAPAGRHVSELLVPSAFFCILSGLFITITRRKALTQILGYLVLENGIYAFGVAALPEHPWIMEMGILLDVFVAMFVMGVAIFHISREFDHIDTDRLVSLQDGEQGERFITSALAEESRTL